MHDRRKKRESNTFSEPSKPQTFRFRVSLLFKTEESKTNQAHFPSVSNLTSSDLSAMGGRIIGRCRE